MTAPVSGRGAEPVSSPSLVIVWVVGSWVTAVLVVLGAVTLGWVGAGAGWAVGLLLTTVAVLR
jgi:hypothetical protein